MYAIYYVKCIVYVQVLWARATLSCFQIARVIYVLWARARLTSCFQIARIYAIVLGKRTQRVTSSRGMGRTPTAQQASSEDPLASAVSQAVLMTIGPAATPAPEQSTQCAPAMLHDVPMVGMSDLVRVDATV